MIGCFLNYCRLKHAGMVMCTLLLFFLITDIKGFTQNIQIYDSIFVIESTHTPDLVLKQFCIDTVHFSKALNNRINPGLTGCEFHYFLLKINSTKLNSEQNLVIDNTSLDTIDIYRCYMDGTSQMLYRGGSLVNFNTRRNYIWHTAPLQLGETPSFYLVAMKAAQKNINVRYEILSEKDLQKNYASYERFVFFYVGIICTIAAIIIFAFITFKKTVFATYLLYITGASGWILLHYGRIFPFLYPGYPIINEIAKPISSLVASLCLVLVLLQVFSQQLRAFLLLEKLLKAMKWFLYLLIALMLLLLFQKLNSHVKFGLMILWHIGLISSASLIVCIPIIFIKYNATAKIFSGAMLVICIMAIVQLFGNLGATNNYFINEHGMTVASLLEIFIMAFGLFYNLLEEQKVRETQVLALEQAQTDTLKKLITLQEDERKRIAGDLHDNIGPLLAALKINFRRIIYAREPDLQNGLAAKTESIIDDSIIEIRNIAHNLMPKGLSTKGLINMLSEYFNGIENLYNKSIVFNHQVQLIFNNELQVNVYRIICELVLNAAKHSNALLISVYLSTHEEKVYIMVADNGCGFKTVVKDQKDSVGLHSAEGRVQYLKGKYFLKSEPGSGTHINIEIPLQLNDTKVHGF